MTPASTLAGVAQAPAWAPAAAEGVLLADLLQQGPQALERVLEIAQALAGALDALHAQGLAHRGLAADRVRWHADGQTVALQPGPQTGPIDEPVAAAPASALAGDLTCLAPEQTGRLQLPVDERADLYAMGALMHALLAGRPLFEAADALGWVHAHLAQPARPLHELRPEVPLALSRLVDRLLAKLPQQRYQSAAGVQADLGRCQAAVRQGAAAADFTLGADDISPRIAPPQRLYGRELPLLRLQAALARARAHGVQGVLLRGPTGAGKSALVRALHALAPAGTLAVATGKVDQFKRRVPYAPLVQAFADLLAQQASRPAAAPAASAPAEASLPAVPPEVLPFLQVLAPPPDATPLPLPEGLSASETKARFARAAAEFIRCRTRPGETLLLFFDDLQWADLATLEVLEHLLLQPAPGPLLLVGAYRDNEVDAHHPLSQVLARLADSGHAAEVLSLGPLAPADIELWLSETLRCSVARAMPLARVVASKTLGNPFFVQRFLSHAQAKGLLVFDRRQRQWHWQLQALQASAVMGDLVAILLSQLEVLDTEDRRLLAVCAVVGVRFDLSELAALTGEDAASLAGMAARARALGFLQDVGGQVHAFVHDQVQAAASRQLGMAERRALHARLGQQLWARLGADGPEQLLFGTVDHLTQGLQADTPPVQRRQLLGLALKAARRARLAGAPAEGLRYARTALACAGDRIWQEEAETARQLFTEAQVLACQAGEHPLAQQLFEILEANPAEPLAHVDSRVAMVQQLTHRGEHEQALDLALGALAGLGLTIDTQRIVAEMAEELARHERMVTPLGYEALLHLPSRSDARIEAIVRLTRCALPAAFFVNPALTPMLGLRVANLCIEHQVLRGTGYILSMVFPAFVALRGDYRSGAPAVRFAMQVAERGQDLESLGEAMHLMGLAVAGWVEPLESVVRHGREAQRLLIEAGSLHNAGFTYCQTIGAQYERGLPLTQVAREIDAAFAFVRKTRNRHAEQAFVAYRQLVRALTGATQHADTFDDAEFSEAEHLRQLGGNRMARCYFHLHRLQLASYRQNEADALRHARAAAELLPAIQGFLPCGSFHLHAALAWCDALQAQPDAAGPGLHSAVAASLQQLQEWAEAAPFTFKHRAALVLAEQAALASDTWSALRLFEEAIALARASGFVHEQGLACLRAARWCCRVGLRRLGQTLRADAEGVFRRWGASTLGAAPAADVTAAGAPHGIDLDSVLQCADAIGGELAHGELVKKLVTVALQNAGAQRALLLCRGSDGRQQPEAWADTTAAGLRVQAAGEGAVPFAVPDALLRPVMRTPAPMLVDDAGSDPRTFADRVVRERGIQSALLLPLLRGHALIGLLYLENNLACGLFTAPRVRVLRVIAGQAAVALESARLFGDLERQVALRTRELEQRNEDLAREVRDRQAAQQLLLATQGELAEAAKMAALGGLVAGIAHEINTPIGLGLTAASHFRHLVDQIEARFRAGELEAAEFDRFVGDSRELARSICVSLEKAARLVRSFKLVAVDQGADDVRRFAVRDYLADVVLTHQPVLRRARASLHLLCDERLTLESHPGAWSQIASNLIGNSLVHAFDGSVPQPTIHIEVVEGDDEVVLTYRDNGRGMDEEVARRVFDPFFTTNRQSGGSGLGMHIVYNVVTQQLRGRIHLSTAPGAGVIFTIRLPKNALRRSGPGTDAASGV